MMMGIKMGHFAGFPKELLGLENKLYVSRDRRAERERRASLLWTEERAFADMGAEKSHSETYYITSM